MKITSVYTAKWRAKNREKYNTMMQDWRAKNRERSCEISRKSYHKNKTRDARRRYHLKSKYGVSLEEYAEKLTAQNGVCAICTNPETSLRRGTIKSLDVDHNHDSGQVRGLLCSACNAALGLLQEDKERLQAMINYLNHWEINGGIR